MSDSENKNKVAAGFGDQIRGDHTRAVSIHAISPASKELPKAANRHSTRDVFLGNINPHNEINLDQDQLSKGLVDRGQLDRRSLNTAMEPYTEALNSAALNSADEYEESAGYIVKNPQPQTSSLGSSYIMIWLSCLHQLRNEVDQQIFSAYLEPLSPIAYSLETNEFKLSAPSKFLINQVERHFTPRITELASEAVANFYPDKEISSPLKVVIVVEEAQPTVSPKNSSPGIFASRGNSNAQSRDAAISMAPHRYVVVKKSIPVERNTQGSSAVKESNHQPSPNSQIKHPPVYPAPTSSHFTANQEQSLRGQNHSANRVGDTPERTRSYQQPTSAINKGNSGSIQNDKSKAVELTVDGPQRVGGEGQQFESGLSRRYSFTNFVVGNSNQFCHAAAMRVAENPGNSYNPLFIYGGVGLGKTHLLHSIGNSVLDKDPNAQILYMSSEAFTNELIQSLRYAKMEEFKRRLRNINVLLIDDIQFIAGKERTQEEFFHTFNALYAAKRQIVITSDRLPSDIPGIEERLQTRFSWGLTADLQAPDFETRVAILKKKGFLDGIDLPEDVAHFIAESVSSNVRELEGALTRLHAVCSIQNIPLTVKSAQSALKAILQPKIVQLSVDDIKKAVASHFGLKVTEMVSKRRTKNLSFPRHIAMYLCRKHTTASYPEIGNNFGGRDHSSVIHAASVVSSKIQSDEEVRSLITDLECQLFNN